jgi:hypothetical protein
MALLNDSLSVWEIGFRWAGLDPAKSWLRLPLPVRDHFRNLVDAILQGHLYCDTLALEKWSEGTGDDPRSYVRYWLDDVYDCVRGVHFNRKLLKWASIDRWAMHLWCERHQIPLPDFWFPSGWGLDYRWPEEAASSEEASDVALGTVIEKTEEGERVGKADPETVVDPAVETPTPERPSTEAKGKRALDRRQRGEIACQEVARRYWKLHPEALLKTVAASTEVQDIAPGSEFEMEVVQRWLRLVDPRDPAHKRGPKRRKI